MGKIMLWYPLIRFYVLPLSTTSLFLFCCNIELVIHNQAVTALICLMTLMPTLKERRHLLGGKTMLNKTLNIYSQSYQKTKLEEIHGCQVFYIWYVHGVYDMIHSDDDHYHQPYSSPLFTILIIMFFIILIMFLIILIIFIIILIIFIVKGPHVAVCSAAATGGPVSQAWGPGDHLPHLTQPTLEKRELLFHGVLRYGAAEAADLAWALFCCSQPSCCGLLFQKFSDFTLPTPWIMLLWLCYCWPSILLYQGPPSGPKRPSKYQCLSRIYRFQSFPWP